jgi:hypothetical protein
MSTEPFRKTYSQEELLTAAKNWLEYHYGDLKKTDPSKFYAMFGLFTEFIYDEVQP